MDRREGRVDPEGGPMSWWLELKRTAPSLSRPQPAYVSSFPSRHPRLRRPAAAPRPRRLSDIHCHCHCPHAVRGRRIQPPLTHAHTRPITRRRHLTISSAPTPRPASCNPRFRSRCSARPTQPLALNPARVRQVALRQLFLITFPASALSLVPAWYCPRYPPFSVPRAILTHQMPSKGSASIPSPSANSRPWLGPRQSRRSALFPCFFVSYASDARERLAILLRLPLRRRGPCSQRNRGVLFIRRDATGGGEPQGMGRLLSRRSVYILAPLWDALTRRRMDR